MISVERRFVNAQTAADRDKLFSAIKNPFLNAQQCLRKLFLKTTSNIISGRNSRRIISIMLEDHPAAVEIQKDYFGKPQELARKLAEIAITNPGVVEEVFNVLDNFSKRDVGSRFVKIMGSVLWMMVKTSNGYRLCQRLYDIFFLDNVPGSYCSKESWKTTPSQPFASTVRELIQSRKNRAFLLINRYCMQITMPIRNCRASVCGKAFSDNYEPA